jgi:hypothetical protein
MWRLLTEELDYLKRVHWLVFLHSEECIMDTNRCPDMIRYYDREMINYDGFIFHAALNHYFSDGSINWPEFNGRFGIRN